jgi:hypothetical protein
MLMTKTQQEEDVKATKDISLVRHTKSLAALNLK